MGAPELRPLASCEVWWKLLSCCGLVEFGLVRLAEVWAISKIFCSYKPVGSPVRLRSSPGCCTVALFANRQLYQTANSPSRLLIILPDC